MDIEHELVISAPLDRVWDCLATADGLNAWWTNTSQADARLGGHFVFGFDEQHQWWGTVCRFAVKAEIEWEMTRTDPMPDWLGTRVGAQLSIAGKGTRLHFHHRGWAAATEHMRVSSYCWATYLRLLARYCVMGEIVPYRRRDDL
jgi:uncharacterized protein YndB with AHSA1/START domain